MPTALIIGDEADQHVAAVRQATGDAGTEAAVINSEALSELQWRWTAQGFEVGSGHEWHLCTKGWQRRLAPAGAHRGIELGSRQAAESSARLALIVALSDAGIEWLSTHWSMVRAENKLVMHRVADELGVRAPASVVVADPVDIPASLGEMVAVKPLGIGDFVDEGQPHAVHTRFVSRRDPDLKGLGLAPFLVQQAIHARTHLRVVTVGGRTWTCRLEAAGLPVDWRAAPEAHHQWQPASEYAVEGDALRIADALGLGYTSQDWIVDDGDLAWLVDVNPAGQWLFLPEPVASEVTSCIATWLTAPGEGRAGFDE